MEVSSDFIVRLITAINEQAPKRATGVYITNNGITWGYRTNTKNFPKNFVPFIAREQTVHEWPPWTGM